MTEVLRAGARQLLVQAVEAEVTSFVEAHEHLTDEAGRRRIVRHGYLPVRQIQTGTGLDKGSLSSPSSVSSRTRP